MGEIVGLVLTGVFAQRDVIALGYPDGMALEDIPIGRWLDAIGFVSERSFTMTYLMLMIINLILTYKLCHTDEDETVGIIWVQIRYSWEEELMVIFRLKKQQPAMVDAPVQMMYIQYLQKLLMTDNRTIIKRIPNLLEQSMLCYGSSKDIGSSSLGATGSNLLQKPYALMEQKCQ
ncbi:unnamed protein product [Rhizopus stolonifer]